MSELQIQSNLEIRIRDLQQQDPEILPIIAKSDAKANVNFSLHPDGLVYFKDRLCVPNNEELRSGILKEAHQSSFSIHPGSVKMYQDLKSLYWWPVMKSAITDFVSRCLTCQKVKVEHQAPVGVKPKDQSYDDYNDLPISLKALPILFSVVYLCLI
ncbi:hypothetical protein V6N13_019840 [Hibiscus sabdariffa]